MDPNEYGYCSSKMVQVEWRLLNATWTIRACSSLLRGLFGEEGGTLAREQAGFRRVEGCAEQVAALVETVQRRGV